MGTEIDRSAIGERVATVEAFLRSQTAETNRRLDEVTGALEKTNLSLQAVCITIAEARGAGKMAKWIGHIVSLIAGALGGTGATMFHK